jgi:hypothetical protein
METISFPEVDRDQLIQALHNLPIIGKPLSTKRNISCTLCGRSIHPLGRLPWAGAPLCQNTNCEMTSLSAVKRLLKTPYGNAIDRDIVRIFSTALEDERIIFQREPIVQRAEHIVDGYIDLLQWQEAYHHYERLTHPERYTLGQISVIPPRRLDDVLVFRALEMPTPTDPTVLLPKKTAELIHRVRKEGSSALAIPF